MPGIKTKTVLKNIFTLGLINIGRKKRRRRDLINKLARAIRSNDPNKIAKRLKRFDTTIRFEGVSYLSHKEVYNKLKQFPLSDSEIKARLQGYNSGTATEITICAQNSIDKETAEKQAQKDALRAETQRQIAELNALKQPPQASVVGGGNGGPSNGEAAVLREQIAKLEAENSSLRTDEARSQERAHAAENKAARERGFREGMGSIPGSGLTPGLSNTQKLLDEFGSKTSSTVNREVDALKRKIDDLRSQLPTLQRSRPTGPIAAPVYSDPDLASSLGGIQDQLGQLNQFYSFVVIC